MPEKKIFSEMTDEELLVEKKKLSKSKVVHATLIGFFAGVLIFGVVSWSLSAEKRIWFLIPMLIPIGFIFKLLKNPNKNKELEEVLKHRNLNG